jgi:hypothetical protein
MFLICRESDIQYVDTHNLFHTPGVYYRPDTLKTMTVLMGNTEARVVFKNIQLENLNVDAQDYSHILYQRYLQQNHFIPPNEQKYFLNTSNNMLPTAPANNTNKGLCNIFPLDLTSDEINSPAISLGI